MPSREQIVAVKTHKEFRAHRSYPLSTSCMPVQSASQQRSDPWSDLRINILITLTPYKLARPLSVMEFCLRDQIHFQTQPRYMVCKNVFFKRTFEQWKWERVWNQVSDTKVWSREYTWCAVWTYLTCYAEVGIMIFVWRSYSQLEPGVTLELMIPRQTLYLLGYLSPKIWYDQIHYFI